MLDVATPILLPISVQTPKAWYSTKRCNRFIMDVTIGEFKMFLGSWRRLMNLSSIIAK